MMEVVMLLLIVWVGVGVVWSGVGIISQVQRYPGSSLGEVVFVGVVNLVMGCVLIVEMGIKALAGRGLDILVFLLVND